MTVKRITLALMAMIMAMGLALGGATSASANNWLYSPGSMPITDPWGNQIGILKVEWDGYALGSYTFHKTYRTEFVPLWTSAHFCYLQWDGGPCRDVSGYDSGWYGSWAGPAVPWPSGAAAGPGINGTPGYGYKPWRACGSITYGGKINQACMWADGGRGDLDPDHWVMNHY